MKRKIKYLLIFLFISSFLSFYLFKSNPVFAEVQCLYCPNGDLTRNNKVVFCKDGTKTTKICVSCAYTGTGGCETSNQTNSTDDPTSPSCNYTGCDTATGEYTLTCDGKFCSTALGDIPTNVPGFVSKVFAVVLSIMGVLAVIFIIISGYRLMGTRGNPDKPEKIQEAKEQLAAAIVGLIFAILSLVMLQFIGFNLLGLPGFKPN